MNILVKVCPSAGSFDWLASLSRQTLVTEWSGDSLSVPLKYAFGVDKQALWFLASRGKAAVSHPEGKLGMFQEELWKYDVAEWFLYNPVSGQYWEFNLSPHGAWWSHGFDAPRVPASCLTELAGVVVQAKETELGWLAMARIPLSSLFPVVGDAKGALALKGCRMAATFIVESPEQIFLTTAEPRIGVPDFHRPVDFGLIEFAEK